MQMTSERERTRSEDVNAGEDRQPGLAVPRTQNEDSLVQESPLSPCEEHGIGSSLHCLDREAVAGKAGQKEAR